MSVVMVTKTKITSSDTRMSVVMVTKTKITSSKGQECVVKMAFFDTFMIKRTINEEIIILLLQQVKIGD